jgi:two-component system cell cycle response regulator
VLVVDDNPRQLQRIMTELSVEHRPVAEIEPENALLTARGPVDVVLVNAAARNFDGLRLAASLRSDERTRHLPVLAVLDADDRKRLVKALEIGVNDVLTRPIDPQEMAARVRTQVKRKRYTDFLRQNLDYSLELAVTDELTGLNNRRFMEGQIIALVERAAAGGESVAALMIDIDHFKTINDTYGHNVGDEVLREFAARLASNVRAIDLPCRYGGEEFTVIMPGASIEAAERVAERIRLHVAGAPFRVAAGSELLNVTISIGVAASMGEHDTPEALIKRADGAVYEAKAAGRNRVIARAA